MDRVLVTIGEAAITLEQGLLGAAGLFVLLLVSVLVVLIRQARDRQDEAQRLHDEAVAARVRSEETERTIADLLRVQSEMTGRMQTMSEIFGSRTSDLARLVNERLDSQGQRIGAVVPRVGLQSTAAKFFPGALQVAKEKFFDDDDEGEDIQRERGG